MEIPTDSIVWLAGIASFCIVAGLVVWKKGHVKVKRGDTEIDLHGDHEHKG